MLPTGSCVKRIAIILLRMNFFSRWDRVRGKSIIITYMFFGRYLLTHRRGLEKRKAAVTNSLFTISGNTSAVHELADEGAGWVIMLPDVGSIMSL